MKTKMKIGDKINVKVACRWGWVKGWRVITGFSGKDVTIRCNSTKDFIVHRKEILDWEEKF